MIDKLASRIVFLMFLIQKYKYNITLHKKEQISVKSEIQRIVK